jgi:RNA polymerase sigma-70 factor, ECF subfamily
MQAVLSEERIEYANRVLATLPPRQLQVLTMSRVEGLKPKEIARRLGITDLTVKKHLANAAKAFKDLATKKGRRHDHR